MALYITDNIDFVYVNDNKRFKWTLEEFKIVLI